MKKNPEKKDEIIKEIKDLFRIGSVPNYTKPVKYNKTADMEKEEENEGEKKDKKGKKDNKENKEKPKKEGIVQIGQEWKKLEKKSLEIEK